MQKYRTASYKIKCSQTFTEKFRLQTVYEKIVLLSDIICGNTAFNTQFRIVLTCGNG